MVVDITMWWLCFFNLKVNTVGLEPMKLALMVFLYHQLVQILYLHICMCVIHILLQQRHAVQPLIRICTTSAVLDRLVIHY